MKPVAGVYMGEVHIGIILKAVLPVAILTERKLLFWKSYRRISLRRSFYVKSCSA